MDRCRVNLAGFGVGSAVLDTLCGVELTRAGDVCNKRTGRRHPENVIRISEVGASVESAVERLRVKHAVLPAFQAALAQCSCVELQVWVSLGDDGRCPSISMSAGQIDWMSKCGARLDVSVS